ncbi:hypothetical protein PRZ48_008215 [Zasmidium cellare]|uniref:Diphthine--ammonia ligase n=1 Tax=Zasmidium cellare TaxID=395010 RepID=A0ABR0EEU8_ZASCE|nr:hypothetical protein PRZ48_008215 [Zasmidium cellare]
MSKLKVVALISGGKDSFFSILHCQANGHDVVALANLHPPHVEGSGQAEDIESYMYQTVGHTVIPLYEEALGLPLYRQEIIGGASNQNKSYGVTPETAQDETESLLPLLRKVLAAHPEVNAVSTGAILSDYQRTRVESVALRLGLTPLSYLWQWPFLPPHTPSSLLEDMASVDQDSRIIKVASGGLDDSFLWQNVADRRTIARLKKATERFGTPGDGAVLGEGGEFETLAISGPAPLWKGDIVVPSEGIHTLPGEAGSASVRISQPTVRPKPGTESAAQVPIPPLLEDRFQSIYEALEAQDLVRTGTASPPPKLDPPLPDRLAANGPLTLSNLIGAGDTPAEQTRSIMDGIISQLETKGQDADNVAYTVITLRDMIDFAAVNAVYGSYFFNPNPPARATIACASVLPTDALLSISITASPDPREGLHVQSRSYWAPANIGPYSQAVRFPNNCGFVPLRGAVLIAGQIPLVPATMDLPKPSDPPRAHDFARQAVLALQHLSRIGRVMKVRRYSYAIALIACVGNELDNLAAKANTVRHAWRLLHEPNRIDDTVEEDDAEFDVWHQTHGSGKTPWMAQTSNTDEDDDNDIQMGVPPLVVISVDSLPRQSDVEWIGCGKTGYDCDETPPLHLRCLLDAFRDRIIPG